MTQYHDLSVARRVQHLGPTCTGDASEDTADPATSSSNEAGFDTGCGSGPPSGKPSSAQTALHYVQGARQHADPHQQRLHSCLPSTNRSWTRSTRNDDAINFSIRASNYLLNSRFTTVTIDPNGSLSDSGHGLLRTAHIFTANESPNAIDVYPVDSIDGEDLTTCGNCCDREGWTPLQIRGSSNNLIGF